MKNIEKTAFHEAGHAVASHFLGRAIKKVTIIPDEECLGRMYNFRSDMPDKLDYEDSPKIKHWVEREIIILLSGLVAEGIATNRNNLIKSHSDLVKAANFASVFVGDGEEMNAYLKYLWIKTKNLFRTILYWEATKVVAAALLEQKSIQGPIVKKIISDGLREAYERDIAKK